ncbi:hypothetical protein SK128_020736, partial [Halocaridina rubra]
VPLAIVLCCAVAAVQAQRSPDIRRISIAEILENNPDLKAELAAKIKARDNEPVTTPRAKTSSSVATTTPATTTTTTSAPQADAPPSAPAETTTPIGGRRRNGRRRRPAGAEGRSPRVRVVPEAGDETPQRQNGRSFPGAS